MSGRYQGQPMRKHLLLPVDGRHFDRWLALFEATARELCPPKAAAHFIERARRIAESIEMGVASVNGVMLAKGERLHRAELDASRGHGHSRSAERLPDRRARPSSRTARSNASGRGVRHGADAELHEEALVLEDLVLEQDLLDHLLGVADEVGAAERASSGRSRRARSAASHARGRSGSSSRRTAGNASSARAFGGVGDVAVGVDAEREPRRGRGRPRRRLRGRARRRARSGPARRR